jgi:hypothetical protein
MKRETSPSVALVFLLLTAPLMFAQTPQSQPRPGLPSDILGPQLIAWSQLQQPQPVAQPLPLSDQSDQQIITGTIIGDGSSYVLRISTNSAYQLADQEKVKQYEGKQVKIDGTLDANGASVHIISIELAS